MAGRVGIEVEGLKELRRSFDRADRKELDRGLRQAHKKVAKDVESDSRGAASGGTAQQAKAIRAILGQGTPESSIIRLRNSAAVPFGIGAFMGALQFKQFPAWVGTAWDIEAGDGPYVVAETIARDMDDIQDTFLDEIGNVLDEYGIELT